MKILIQNGRLINPRGENGQLDIAIQGGIIEQVAAHIDGNFDRTIDASGLAVFPGLIDMHVHLREPGYEYKETIESGTRAASHGGFTAVACMPNTSPVADDPSVVSYILEQAKQAGHARVYPIACITKGLKGEEISEMRLLAEAGAIAYSDDGRPVMDAQIMRLALLYAKSFGGLVISHCEDLNLINGGVMNEGETATRLGLRGITRAAEEVMVARDILLAQTYGARVHIAHISTAGSAELVRRAKADGVHVTAETAPHYFTADDTWVEGYDARTKVNPPLRTAEDVAAIRRALADGTIDAIATDHAPHHADEKHVEYDLAANGISGLEFALPLSLALVREGVLSLERMTELLSCAPARILGVPGGVIEAGAPADLTLADLECNYALTAQDLRSKGKNSPFLGRPLRGKAVYTIVEGRVTEHD